MRFLIYFIDAEIFANESLFISQVLLENITLRLNEDRPPNNITSPGPIPIDVSVSKLRITRDAAGVFHIEPAGKLLNNTRRYR